MILRIFRQILVGGIDKVAGIALQVTILALPATARCQSHGSNTFRRVGRNIG
ncbi:hypothetical protein O9929_23220 [Vibrio lentus]|nr:hypothetical protein [Vibrio lentus]